MNPNKDPILPSRKRFVSISSANDFFAYPMIEKELPLCEFLRKRFNFENSKTILRVKIEKIDNLLIKQERFVFYSFKKLRWYLVQHSSLLLYA
ncbi:unnamed protein product [Brassica rapa]|uniref:Uncharacterized protein n=1 Tax=Brassica campestris TaxID=3711 RepID=A0A8D9DJ07_BRACM|nr:unnamed protein product [Brassica rapa]